MRILFLGDVIGRGGRDAVAAALPDFRRRLRLDLVIVNGENASHGFGLSPEMATLGNHAWDRREIIPFIASEKRVLRPINFPPGTPGAGSVILTLGDGRRAMVINAMGRLFMDALDCPFRATEDVLTRHKLGQNVQAAVVDFHAEATSEKEAFAHVFDGRLSLVVGTHTHVPTADHQILEKGTGYMTDAGMCGAYDSVIGMVKGPAAERFWRKMPGERLAPAEGPVTISGVFLETDDTTGLARHLAPEGQGGRLSPAFPESVTMPN
jgi:metallophosphoesterase (TIGR00282 family)